jgi:hypothetical protein
MMTVLNLVRPSSAEALALQICATYWEALYFSFVTMSTIGYGDYPRGAARRPLSGPGSHYLHVVFGRSGLPGPGPSVSGELARRAVSPSEDSGRTRGIFAASRPRPRRARPLDLGRADGAPDGPRPMAHGLRAARRGCTSLLIMMIAKAFGTLVLLTRRGVGGGGRRAMPICRAGFGGSAARLSLPPPAATQPCPPPNGPPPATSRSTLSPCTSAGACTLASAFRSPPRPKHLEPLFGVQISSSLRNFPMKLPPGFRAGMVGAGLDAEPGLRDHAGGLQATPGGVRGGAVGLTHLNTTEPNRSDGSTWSTY